MKKIFNRRTILVAVGVLQPTAGDEVHSFLQRSLPEIQDLPSVDDLAGILDELAAVGQLILVATKPKKLFSLSHKSGLYLTPRLRRFRDKWRLYLLKNAFNSRRAKSRRGSRSGLAGASPAVDTSTRTKGSAANKESGRRFVGQPPYWPRIGMQFQSKTGVSGPRRDNLPAYVSFYSLRQAAEACGVRPESFSYDYVGMATCLGITPKLISQLIRNPARHYRTFEIPKKSGGTRTICSPRVFLKMVQRYLAVFVLNQLPVSSCVHSYRFGRSAVSNALPHVGKQFVAHLDIVDFFGSILIADVMRLLTRNGFRKNEAELISKLCTLEGALPQGAPTSPIISNSLLHNTDRQIAAACFRQRLSYTRYADDITISGDNREQVLRAIELARKLLHLRHGLRVNEEKTRVSSHRGQQKVTGVVVNAEATLPRNRLRQIRAVFHQAQLRPVEFAEKISELAGYLGLLAQLPKFADSRLLGHYYSVLRVVRDSRAENVDRPRVS